MFNGVEYTYKKNSLFNKAMKKATLTSFLILFLTLAILIPILYNCRNFSWFIIVNIILALFATIAFGTLILYLDFKNLGAKFSFNFKIYKENIFAAVLNARKQEIILIKNWLIQNDCYNTECIKVYMDHYRNLNNQNDKESNFWSIMAIIQGGLIAIITAQNKEIVNTLFGVLFILIVIGMYIKIMCGFFIDVKKVVTGEDELYERLKEIFFQLYIDLINEPKKKKNPIKNILKKWL